MKMHGAQLANPDANFEDGEFELLQAYMGKERTKHTTLKKELLELTKAADATRKGAGGGGGGDVDDDGFSADLVLKAVSVSKLQMKQAQLAVVGRSTAAITVIIPTHNHSNAAVDQPRRFF